MYIKFDPYTIFELADEFLDKNPNSPLADVIQPLYEELTAMHDWEYKNGEFDKVCECLSLPLVDHEDHDYVRKSLKKIQPFDIARIAAYVGFAYGAFYSAGYFKEDKED